MQPTTLSVKDIAFRYDDRTPYIFNNVSFSLSNGDVLALLGRNGVGKSTLLQCLLGGLAVAEGHIMYDDYQVSSMNPKEIASYVAFVPQLITNDCTYTVFDYILFGCAVRKGVFDSPNQEDKSEAQRILAMLELEHLQDRPCHELSGGQRQLVSIGRALMQQAPILLLDEPTAALDVYNQMIVLRMIDQLRKWGYIVIFSTHLPEQVLLLDSQIALFKPHAVDVLPNATELTESMLRDVYDTPLKLIYNSDMNRTICVVPHL